MYRKPELVSFDCGDIVEIFGPAQNSYLDVGGGVQEAMLNREVIEYRVAAAPSELELPKAARIKTVGKTTV